MNKMKIALTLVSAGLFFTPSEAAAAGLTEASRAQQQAGAAPEAENSKPSWISSFIRRPAESESIGERPMGMILYAGPSLYGDSRKKGFKSRSFSSFLMGFQQQMGNAPILGDVFLKTEIQNFHLKKERATQINVTAAFSRPGWEKAFPIYVGAGAGAGFYPFYILKQKPFLSLNAQLFTGLRLLNLYENLGLNLEVSMHFHFPFRESELYMDVFAGLGAFFSF